MMYSATTREGTCLLPPSIPGSVGDEKAMRTCVQMLSNAPLTILNYEQGTWDFVAPNARSIAQFGSIRSTAYYKASGIRKFCSIAIIGWQFLLRMPAICHAMLKSKCFVILGMDIMDGHYGALSALHKITLAYLASWLGTDVQIINCSFNDHPSRIVVFALRHMPTRVRIVAREPLSHARMEHFLQRPVALSADVAFLLATDLPGENPLQEHIDWIMHEKSNGKTIIALNLADNHNYNQEQLLAVCARTIQEHEDSRFILIPHAAYTRHNLPNENTLMQKLLDRLPPETKKHCRMIRLPCDPRALQHVLQHIDIGICGRMHLAIGLLSAGVPAYCIGYQNKFEGLLKEYLHMPQLLLNMQQLFSEGSFGTVLQSAKTSRNADSATIKHALPQLQALARNNFIT